MHAETSFDDIVREYLDDGPLSRSGGEGRSGVA